MRTHYFVILSREGIPLNDSTFTTPHYATSNLVTPFLVIALALTIILTGCKLLMLEVI